MRRALIPVLAIATVVAGGIEWTASTASSATTPTYSLTVAGTDMHSLDPLPGAMFVDRGGVKAVMDSQQSVQLQAFEVGLTLPVGATVTSIGFTRTYCRPNTDTYVRLIFTVDAENVADAHRQCPELRQSVCHDEPYADLDLKAPDVRRRMERTGELTVEMERAGAQVFVAGLRPASSATVVRTAGGQVLMTDAALAWVAKASTACERPVEVRPTHA